MLPNTKAVRNSHVARRAKADTRAAVPFTASRIETGPFQNVGKPAATVGSRLTRDFISGTHHRVTQPQREIDSRARAPRRSIRHRACPADHLICLYTHADQISASAVLLEGTAGKRQRTDSGAEAAVQRSSSIRDFGA
eukprot:1190538-Prorocentrum_minimum.AAC.1